MDEGSKHGANTCTDRSVGFFDLLIDEGAKEPERGIRRGPIRKQGVWRPSAQRRT